MNCPICTTKLTRIDSISDAGDVSRGDCRQIFHITLRCDTCGKQTQPYAYEYFARQEARTWNADAGYCPVCAKPLEAVQKRGMTGTRCNTCRRTDYAPRNEYAHPAGMRYMEDEE